MVVQCWVAAGCGSQQLVEYHEMHILIILWTETEPFSLSVMTVAQQPIVNSNGKVEEEGGGGGCWDRERE